MAKRDGMVPLGIRFSMDVIRRIDGFVASERQAGREVSRSSAVRQLVERALREAGFGRGWRPVRRASER